MMTLILRRVSDREVNQSYQENCNSFGWFLYKHCIPIFTQCSPSQHLLLHYATPLNIPLVHYRISLIITISTLYHPLRIHIITLCLLSTIPIITVCHPTQAPYYYIMPSLSVSLLVHNLMPLGIPIITLRYPAQCPYHYFIPCHSISMVPTLFQKQNSRTF